MLAPKLEVIGNHQTKGEMELHLELRSRRYNVAEVSWDECAGREYTRYYLMLLLHKAEAEAEAEAALRCRSVRVGTTLAMAHDTRHTTQHETSRDEALN